MEAPAYLPYLNFVEDIIAFVNQVLAIIFFAHLIFCVFFQPKKLKFTSKLPSIMLMFILNHLFWSCTAIPYRAYMAIGWRVDHNEYNPYLIFWLALSMNAYMVVSPLQKNRIVKLTIIAEVLFNVLPAWSSALYNNLFAADIANYLGQYVGMSMTCDAAMCSIVYSVVFLKNNVLTFRRLGVGNTNTTAAWATASMSRNSSR
ncbi:hypothetical protein Ddc_16433 [Ditylenchus destructor]|nr:hypothetical protein Ddc_16433 [Ditylenchus destructor]